jgi:hypothetical protein
MVEFRTSVEVAQVVDIHDITAVWRQWAEALLWEISSFCRPTFVLPAAMQFF